MSAVILSANDPVWQRAFAAGKRSALKGCITELQLEIEDAEESGEALPERHPLNVLLSTFLRRLSEVKS